MVNVKRWEVEDHWVEIDLDLCSGIRECVNACPVSVYELVDGKVKADIKMCIECGACEGICPKKAILSHWAWI